MKRRLLAVMSLGLVVGFVLAMVVAAGAATPQGCDSCGHSVDNDFDYRYANGKQVFTTDLAVRYAWDYNAKTVTIKGWNVTGKATPLGANSAWRIVRYHKDKIKCFAKVAGKPKSACLIKVQVLLASADTHETVYMRAYLNFNGQVQAANSLSAADPDPLTADVAACQSE